MKVSSSCLTDGNLVCDDIVNIRFEAEMIITKSRELAATPCLRPATPILDTLDLNYTFNTPQPLELLI